MTNPPSPRRRVLLGGGAALGGALLPHAPTRAAEPAAPPLKLTADTTEGPYYFDAGQVRRDITEGHAGVPVTVRFTVLDLRGRPWRGARVDIWHCNAQGIYSGYARQGDSRQTSAQGQTFLRGTQFADAAGEAAFDSIYPGWYEGRATHIHFKVFNGARAVLTSQFFLPDALSEFLYTQLPAYQRARLRDTLNSTDGIAIEAGDTVLGSVREAQGRYLIALNVVADPSARPVVDRPPAPGEGPPPGASRAGAGGPPQGWRGGPPPRPQALEGDARRDALLPTAERRAAAGMPPRR
ncbi:MAG: intradiol ring-cleavage dioxygenase [Ottowia sp.]|uniref:intradiol ring-cleavage dioxygenase n=1 Tax=Ottowia sp. TaxID=1898956 RepID=UPI0039E4029A